MKMLIIIGFLLALTQHTYGQKKAATHKPIHTHKQGARPVKHKPMPVNGQGYYDAVKGAYVFPKNGATTVVRASDPVPVGRVMPRTSVPITNWLGLDLYPQLNYPYYQKLYPVIYKNVNDVPVMR